MAKTELWKENFDDIVLSRRELGVLKTILEQDVVPYDNWNTEPYQFLQRLKLIESCCSDRFPEPPYEPLALPVNAIRLTDKGRVLLQKKGAELAADRKTGRRYWITTSIAILALILSVLSLSWQVYDATHKPISDARACSTQGAESEKQSEEQLKLHWL